jgi:hypothetical protein
MNRGLLFAGLPPQPLGGCERKDYKNPLGGRLSDALHIGAAVGGRPLLCYIDGRQLIAKSFGKRRHSLHNQPLPPLPSYLFSPCCSDPSQCTNAKNKGYSEELLSNFIGIRNALIKMLVAQGLNNFKVTDCCCTTYKHLARRCLECLNSMLVMPSKCP